MSFESDASSAIRALLARASPGGAPLRVLEVGCGKGALAAALATEFAGRVEYTAIDPFPGTIAAARDAHAAVPGLSFVESDLLAFPGREAAFDAVLCQRSLHHVFPLDEAVAKIRALLRPGGVLLAEEFGRDLVSEEAALFLFDRVDLIRALAGDGEGGPEGSGHDHGGHDHGHGGHAHGGGEEGGHSHGGAGHDHGGERPLSGHGGHAHADAGGDGGHSHSHAGEGGHAHGGDAAPAPAAHAPASEPRSHHSYVHGHSHVGRTPSDGLPREGLPHMPPLDRWRRMTFHNPPLPGSAEIAAALRAGFGEGAVKVDGGRAALYLMGMFRVARGAHAEEVKEKVGELFRAQEERCIAEGRFAGIGMVYTCTKL